MTSLVYSRTVSSKPALVFWGVAVCFAGAGVASFWVKTDRGSGVNGGDEEGVMLEARDR